MSLRPVLFVGCGGSGGATLQYVMDNLRTELTRVVEAKLRSEGPGQLTGVNLGLRGLPDAWQFVHVDVPGQPDTADQDRPPTVPEQGGLYVGLAPEGLTYAQVESSVWNAAGAARPDLMSGWLRKPGPGDPKLAFGAGQERAVGRAATLSDLAALKEALEQAKGRAIASQAASQLTQLGALLSYKTILEPTVFIVSSMSGGSGASMVLDVAQVLAGIDPGLATTASLFLYTSEVFSSLPVPSRRGVESNGLAAMGELLATSLGANSSDRELFGVLGVNGADVARPFRRVFPIGNRHGQNQATFGDGSQETIYRAVGRGLAGLVSSPSALRDFISYDVTNNNSTQIAEGAAQWLGEGSGNNADEVSWGCFGFARLSLGRDRYGEYVAQRLAGEAVDRLVAGHVRDTSQAGEQQLGLVTADAYARLTRSLGLPGAAVGASVAEFVSRANGPAFQQELAAAVRAIVTKELFGDANLNLMLPGEKFVALLRQLTAARRGAVTSEAQSLGYARAHAWQRQFARDVVLAVDEIAARDGLGVARQVVVRLKEDTSRWANQLRTEAYSLVPAGNTNLPDPPAQVLAPIQALPSVPADHPLRHQLTAGFVSTVSRLTAGSIGKLIADALDDFAQGMANPLIAGLQAVQAQLVAERSRAANKYTVTELRTPLYVEWPRAGRPVPDRFRGAGNEVLLMDVGDFPAQFDAHLAAVARNLGQSSADAATKDHVLTAILRSRWLGHHDSVEASQVIWLPAAWVPPGLTVDPQDPASVVARSAARFDFKFGPTDVLERARLWVWRHEGEYAPYLNAGLHGYITDPHLTPSDYRQRHSHLVAKFGEALQQALPLVQINSATFGLIHGSHPLEEFKFSELPFAGCDALLGDLEGQLRGRSASAQSVIGLTKKELQSTNAGVTHIDVFGSYTPMSPLAFPSLLKPLADSWTKAVADGNTQFFWTNRRARPLPGCIAMSTLERRATLAGYVVGKVTGRLRGSYKPGSFDGPIEVFYEPSNAWLKFPFPLLSPYVENQASDEYAALLESHLLAIAKCGYDSTLAPLLPYVAMRRLFGRLTNEPGSTQFDSEGRAITVEKRPLQQWISDGHRLSGGGSIGPERLAVKEGWSLATAEDRTAATERYLNQHRERARRRFATDTPERNPQLQRYVRRPLAAALAGDFVWALDAVLDAVRNLQDEPEWEDM